MYMCELSSALGIALVSMTYEERLSVTLHYGLINLHRHFQMRHPLLQCIELSPLLEFFSASPLPHHNRA